MAAAGAAVVAAGAVPADSGGTMQEHTLQPGWTRADRIATSDAASVQLLRLGVAINDSSPAGAEIDAPVLARVAGQNVDEAELVLRVVDSRPGLPRVVGA